MSKLIFIVFFIIILTLKTYANQKDVYFFFQDQFLVIYNEDNNKLFVDFNSGFVIKPEDQQKKIRFVEYLLDTKSFISRDEDVFTKLYIFKKSINFDFNEVEPSDLDYYSWGPLTYKYLAIFCKKINDSITIRIPSFEQLNQETKKDIVDRYRLVFGTSFNEPRYLPYDIKIKNKSVNKNIEEEIYKTTTLYNTEKNVTDTTNITTTNVTTVNITTVNITTGIDTFSDSTNRYNYFEIFKKKEIFFIFAIIIGISLIVMLVLLYKKFPSSIFGKPKNNPVNSSLSLGDGLSVSETVVSGGNSTKSVQDEIKKITNEINNLKEKISFFENQLSQIISKLDKFEEDINKRNLSLELKDSLLSELNEDESNKDSSFVSQEYITQNEKLLDNDSLEVIMFKIDNLVNKLKRVEMYKEYDINSKSSKAIQELYNFKAKIRNTKTINFSQWDSFIKENIIDLLSTLDRYLKRMGPNENIIKLRKEIMNDTSVEEIYIVPGQSKVNIIDHRVEGYSRSAGLPPGVITEVKEEGYKYKGITIKRAKVIENKP
ncbi:MAG: coiled-coil domain-containing protein [bacterium]